jgi:hypothetical protein
VLLSGDGPGHPVLPVQPFLHRQALAWRQGNGEIGEIDGKIDAEPVGQDTGVDQQVVGIARHRAARNRLALPGDRGHAAVQVECETLRFADEPAGSPAGTGVDRDRKFDRRHDFAQGQQHARALLDAGDRRAQHGIAESQFEQQFLAVGNTGCRRHRHGDRGGRGCRRRAIDGLKTIQELAQQRFAGFGRAGNGPQQRAGRRGEGGGAKQAGRAPERRGSWGIHGDSLRQNR